jgi:hypothetical protein
MKPPVRSRLTAWQRAITCFNLPTIWLAVGLLLLNDHYLKTAFPSWITGKLSDIAGLFFFPLLLATLFSPLGERLRLSWRQIGGVAFCVTAVWFALMKTSSLVNGITITLWQLIVQWSVRIVMDPTDLVALIMLWPAWCIWNNAPHSPWRSWQRLNKRGVTWLPLSVIAVASLAALATSPPDYPEARRLAVVENQLYVGLGSYWPDAQNDNWPVFRCDADFDCSQRVTEVSDELWTALGDDGLKSVVCLDSDSQHCYRMGDEIVEVSIDGGQSWQIAWQIPPGRRQFMENLHAATPLVGKYIAMGPYDLVIMQAPDNEYNVVAALGNEGLLVRLADGTWERRPIGNEVLPTPYEAEGWYTAHLSLFREYAIWQALWLLLFLLTYCFNWFKQNELIVALFLSLLISVAIFVGLSLFENAFILGYLLSILALTTTAIRWWDTEENTAQRRMALWYWLLGLAVGSAAFAPMILWSLGTITFYDTAKTISFILGAAALVPSGYSALLGWRITQKEVD